MSTWALKDGTKVEGIRIKERFADGEYIVAGGNKVLVRGNVECILGECHKVNFDIWGLYTPKLRCSEIKGGVSAEFRDEWDSTKVFDSHWKKYLKRQEFSGEVGKLMMERLPSILDYSFTP